MNKRSPEPKTFGLLGIVILSVMALTAVSAQAAPHFNIKTTELKTSKSILASTTNAVTLQWSITALGVPTLCKSVVATAATIEGAGHGKGSFVFTECKPDNPQCKVEEPIIAEVLSQLFKHTDNKIYVLFSQQPGKAAIASLTFLDAIEPGGCPLPVSTPLPVTGSTVGSIDNANVATYETDQLTHTLTFSTTLEALFSSHKLKLGTNNATFMGEGNQFLCSDENWSVRP